MANEDAQPKPPKIEGTEKPPKEKKPKKEKPPKIKKERVPKVKKEKVLREPGEKKPLNKKLLFIILGGVLVVLLLVVLILLLPKLKKDETPADSTVISSSEPASDIASSEDSASEESDASSEQSSAPEESSSAAAMGDPTASDGAESFASSEGMTGGVNGVNPPAAASSSPPEKELVFSEETLSLPVYQYQGGAEDSAFNIQVHNDMQAFLNEREERPGVGVSATVVIDRYTMEDGTVRALVYVWENRYAVVESTLFDYASVAGPCAVDYKNGVFQEVYLPMSGDQFEQTVRLMCGPKEAVADRMIRKSFDLELRGQMIRNVSSYIARNNPSVEYFRSGGQTYYKDGTIYIPEDKKTTMGTGIETSGLTQDPQKAMTDPAATSSSSASSTTSLAASASERKTDEQLKQEYEETQKIPV